MKLTRAEQGAVRKAEGMRDTAMKAIEAGDMDRAAAYLQAASDWFGSAAQMVALRRQRAKEGAKA